MPRRVYSAAPCFGRAQRWAGVDGLPPARWTGVGVERRGEAAFAKLVTGWQRSARAAATALSTTDGRWAFVSTSVTALVAGAIPRVGGGNDRLAGGGNHAAIVAANGRQRSLPDALSIVHAACCRPCAFRRRL